MPINRSIRLAFHIPTKKVIHIDNAENGNACNCECFECGEKLVAKQGSIRDKHFSHTLNLNCSGAQESALHQLGKQILLDNTQIVIPKYGLINYISPYEEKNFESIRPDVTALFDGQKIYFEIAVKHFIENDKKQFFNNGQHKCVEIDLSACVGLPDEEIKEFVLRKTSNKTLYGWGSKYGWLVGLGAVAAFFLIILGIRKR